MRLEAGDELYVLIFSLFSFMVTNAHFKPQKASICAFPTTRPNFCGGDNVILKVRRALLFSIAFADL